MRNLYFIRHGESKDNLDGVWSRPDSPLTALGKWQASAAGAELRTRGQRIDRIVSSPFPRALETARLIANEIDYDHNAILSSALLGERDWGELTGMPHRDFFDRGLTHKDIDSFTGAETLPQLETRAKSALQSIKDIPEENVLIVSHGTFGRALRRVIAGEPWENEFQKSIESMRIPNARILQLLKVD